MKFNPFIPIVKLIDRIDQFLQHMVDKRFAFTLSLYPLMIVLMSIIEILFFDGPYIKFIVSLIVYILTFLYGKFIERTH